MADGLTAEEAAIVALVREFVDREVRPVVRELEHANAYPEKLIGQMKDQRPPFSKADAEAIRTPTLFIGGANTKGTFPQVLHALAANVKGSRTELIPNATHPMFEQAPQAFCNIVLAFLAA